MFKTICSSIDKLDKMSWNDVRDELVKVKGVPEKSADIIGSLTQFKGKPCELLELLRSENVFKQEGEKLKDVFSDMDKLFSYLKAFDKIDKVSFDLSLARGLDYYTGVIYEIVLTDKTT